MWSKTGILPVRYLELANKVKNAARYFFILSLLLLTASKPTHQIDALPQKFLLDIPSNLSDTLPVPARNPLTKEGVKLGKMLFFDPVLSGNNQISCATCHQPSRAFTDGLALSDQGESGKPLHRNAPSLVNLAWHKGLFWDGGASDLESLVFGPLTHPDEMGQDLHALVQELNEKAVYRKMFKSAFGEDTIYSALVGRALAQYIRTLISANSRYDQFVRNEPGANFSGMELKGMETFEQKCGSCHPFGKGNNNFFTDHQYHNNGLDSTFPNESEGIFQGRFRITRDSTDMGKFKTPTLRNIALTAPYMHNGRFATLEEVLDHYDSKMEYSSTLDSIFYEDEGRAGISLTEAEKEAIIAFLHTLTNTAFVQNYANKAGLDIK